MLYNLVPDFLSALEQPDPQEAYRRYIDDNLPILQAYWHNYILDLESPHAADVIRRSLVADRRDLRSMLEGFDIVAAANETIERCKTTYAIDIPFDVYLTVGVGGANAGELVVGGRGIAFVCLEHFTGRPNPDTLGLGLPPQLMTLWLAHELAHVVRYTSPTSRGELRQIVQDSNGYYDFWESGGRATLRELLVNEGLAVSAAQQATPGFEQWEYFGYRRRQYRRLRELEAFLRRCLRDELDHRGLGYRLRYLSGGMSPSQRLVGGKVIPERAGYYVGHRLVEAIVAEHGLARALRATAEDCQELDDRLAGAQTA
jgi:hypothetical protein